MDSSLIEQLLYEDESSELDFKRDQYKFEGASDYVKSELLKDILAFANAWRRSDAYILVGVEEVKGGRSIPVGVEKHLEDSNLQEFVNSKTERPLTFSYRTAQVDGKSIGVIHIPTQRRPFAIKEDFGKVKAKHVYLRRGSSTAVASTDEVAQMGADSTSRGRNVDLEVSLAQPEIRKRVEGELHFDIDVPLHPVDDIPMLSKNPYSVEPINEYYYIDYSEYLRKSQALRPFGFAITNHGDHTARSTRLEIYLKPVDGVVYLEHYLPDRPVKKGPYINTSLTRDLGIDSEINEYEDRWEIHCPIGNIQPKATEWSSQFYIAGPTGTVDLDVRLFSDDLSEPLEDSFSISFETNLVDESVEELIEKADQK